MCAVKERPGRMGESILIGLMLLAVLFGAPWLRSVKQENSPPAEGAAQVGQKDSETTLTVWDGEKNVTMPLAEYLPGVVRGEMPAAFEMEALKAQAVAERTYAYYRKNQQRKSAHPEADVCLDSTCCAAYLSEEAAREKWGSDFAGFEEKIQQAVKETDGQVVLYDDQPIMAVFHSSSAGHTAGSGDVWAGDVPYLVSVTTPEGGADVPNYYSVVTLSPAEFKTAFSTAYPKADLSGEPSAWFKNMERSAADRVANVTVGGVEVTGTELRQLLGLRSTCFTQEYKDGALIFRVTGYGHGVGMSQYGANVLAKEGKTYQEILQWYYTGVTVSGYTK